MKQALTVLLACLCATSAQASDLVISGVIDGPLSGGLPKMIRVTAVNDIADLSRCGLGSANNGGGTDGQEFTFPAATVSSGEAIYVASESAKFNQFFGFNPTYTSGVASINGDDAIELFCDGEVVDTFGEINQDGSGQSWEYLDGWASRIDGTQADGSSFNINSWTFSGKNKLDGESSNDTASTPFPLSPSSNDGGSDQGDDGDSGSGGADDGNASDNGTISGACFNCPDLTPIKSAAEFDDANYYASVFNAINQNFSVSEIKLALTQAITEDHKNLTYSEVWTALTKTDEDPNNTNNVILLYKGTSIAKSANGSGAQSSNPDNWNREHVWAKSHGFPSSSQEGYTDIHHLRPTDISVNASRGNLDFDTSDDALAEAPANRVDDNSFEPRDDVKGDVARMVLYMDTRYEGFGADNTPDLQAVNRLTSTGEAALGKLCTLLAWHNQDPVSGFEIQRNNSIYEFQGNRNPYIDHPEWVSKVYTTASCDDGNDTGDDSNSGDDNGGDTGDDAGDNDSGNNSSATILISEYLEKGNNKALELFNTTAQSIDLSAEGYTLQRFSNGSTNGSTVSLQGTIPAKGTHVLVYSQAAGALKALADQISGSLSHNGDDAYVLFHNGEVIDSFGRVGQDPGRRWQSGEVKTDDMTLVRKASVINGDVEISDDFDVAAEWNGFPQNTFDYLGSHDFDGGTNNDTGNGNDDETSGLGQCNTPATLISSIQGSGEQSPLLGESHVIEGVVTASFDALGGFFMQEEQGDYDNDTQTSEGIFVKSDERPAVETVVRVMGDVSESYARTQLVATANLVDCGVGTLDYATLQLPFVSATAAEAIEGMLVASSDALTVTNTFDLAKWGQLTLSSDILYNPTNVFTPGSEQALALAEQNQRDVIILDDANNSSYPETVIFPTGGLSASNSVRIGDGVLVKGIVDFSFGSYRILPTSEPTFIQENPRTAYPSVAEGNIKVAGLNVLNLFNGNGQGEGFPTSRGADSEAEFNRQIAKTVNTILAIDADVIGLMEIENDGSSSTSMLADLVSRLNAQAGSATYDFVNTNGQLGTDAIAVALLYKPAKVKLASSAIINNDSIFNRPPLAQVFELQENGETITVVVNHFKSKGCGGASGADADQNDGQGCFNARRTAQSQILLGWLANEEQLVEQQNVLIIGDLNAYAKEDPITAITTSGFTNLIAEFEGQYAYSYGFKGQVGYLDHALASASLAEKAVDATSWHINAVEPIALDYNVEKKSAQQQLDWYADNVYRASDHDPIIVTFDLVAPTLVGDWDGDGDIDIHDVRAFVRAIQTKQAIPPTYDLNNDGRINIVDARLLMSRCTNLRCAP